MTERLSDADLDAAARLAAGEAIGAGRAGRVTSLAFLGELVAALRAQQAPTTDEPAAWLVEYVDEDSEEMVYLDRRLADVYADQEGGEVVPLYRHPAPATDDPTARVLAVLNDWETEEPEDGWGTLADDIRAALTQGGGDRG